MTARKRGRRGVALCAALTVDGKLDAAGSVRLAEILLRGGDAKRHPWAVHFDRTNTVIVDEALAAALSLERTGIGHLLVIAPEQSLDTALTRITKQAWCFGGSALFRALLERDQVDKMFLQVRPQVDGRRAAATLSGVPGPFFSASVACRLVRMEVHGSECFLRYHVVRGDAAAGRPA